MSSITKDYSEMSVRELWEAMDETVDPCELRKIHKALRRYGSGVPIWRRFPNLSVGICTVTLLLVLAKLVLGGILR